MKPKKLKNVTYNNRKKEIGIEYQRGKSVVLHYSQLGIKNQQLVRAGVDPESNGIAFFYETASGEKEFVPYDVPLILDNDADYLFQTEIEELIADIKRKMQEKGVSKKYLARSLGTSDMQIERLLNPDNPNKNFLQLNKIAKILGLSLKIQLTDAA